MKILSFGEILFDIIDGKYYLGGAPLNFAAHLAQCGQESYILSRVGTDTWGKKAYRRIGALGIKTALIQKDKAHPTGTVTVALQHGQPDYIVHRHAAYDYIDLSDGTGLLDRLDFEVLYFGTLAQRHAHSANTLRQLIAQKQFPHIFYDINLRKEGYTSAIIRSSLDLCTMLKLNNDEVHVLSEMLYRERMSLPAFLAQVKQDFKIDIVIVTAGAEGCYIYQSAKLFFIGGYPVRVKDTIGAGDAFSAAFISCYLKRKNVIRAAEIANKVGSFVAGSRGAIPVYSSEIKQEINGEII